jgi:uncharacterized membrane protein YfcA
MLLSDPVFFAFAIPAVVFAGVSKGGFGSGAAFASATILALILDPGQALALMLPLLMVIVLASLGPYWKKWRKAEAGLLLAGGVPGVLLGALLYRAVDADAIRVLIGAVALAFVGWHLWQRLRPGPVAKTALGSGAGVAFGVGVGFASFVSHAGGPPAAVFLLSRHPDKTEYQATTVLVFWVLNIVKFVPYAYLGFFSLDMAVAGLVLAPFALLGTWIGIRAHRAISERLFFGLTYVLLLSTGTKLIWDGLS